MITNDLQTLRNMVRGYIADAEDHPMFLLLIVTALPSGLRLYAQDAWKKPAKSLRDHGLVDLDSYSLVTPTDEGRRVANWFREVGEMPYTKTGTWEET